MTANGDDEFVRLTTVARFSADVLAVAEREVADVIRDQGRMAATVSDALRAIDTKDREGVAAAVRALQDEDRLRQHLEHVQMALTVVTDVLAEVGSGNDHVDLRRALTERLLADKKLGSVKARYLAALSTTGDQAPPPPASDGDKADDDIELF